MHSVSQRRRCSVPRPAVIFHPWQTDTPLPSSITIDVSHHHPRSLPAPDGWEIIQRNGRVWIAEHSNRVARIDAAQYRMLLATYCGQEGHNTPSTHFLGHFNESCRAQQDADQTYCVPWSRHLLASIRQITGADLLIGASAVNYTPTSCISPPHTLPMHLSGLCLCGPKYLPCWSLIRLLPN